MRARFVQPSMIAGWSTPNDYFNVRPLMEDGRRVHVWWRVEKEPGRWVSFHVDDLHFEEKESNE